MTEKRRYIQYDTETNESSLTPFLTENDLLEAPDHIIYFSTKEEYKQFHRKLQVTSSNENNINHNKVTEDVTESIGDNNEYTFDNTNDTNKAETKQSFEKRGGKRIGAGRKKGFKHSVATINKISETNRNSMKHNQNAKKDTQK
jgi:hypothetical protein